jgi:hypothetical protein
MHYFMQNIERYLLSCRELFAFCSQDGWIDDNTLVYEIIEQNDHEVIAFVQFSEIVPQAAGSVAGRVQRQGRLRLRLDRYGRVEHAELL